MTSNSLSEVDWIIEAVVENLDIKRALLKKVEAVRKPGTIVTTNTSGLPVAKIAEGFSDDFRRSLVGHAFFQSAALHAAAGNYSPRRKQTRAAIEAVAHFSDVQSRQGRGFRQGHAQLHCQPHRHVFRAERHAPDAGDGPEHRRCRRADRRRGGMAEVRDVPHHRSGRARHSGARGRQHGKAGGQDEPSRPQPIA